MPVSDQRRAVDERFDWAEEEMAEVIQAIKKFKRFGAFNHHPDRPTATNRGELEMEIGHLLRAFDELALQGVIRYEEVVRHQAEKHREFKYV